MSDLDAKKLYGISITDVAMQIFLYKSNSFFLQCSYSSAQKMYIYYYFWKGTKGKAHRKNPHHKIFFWV